MNEDGPTGYTGIKIWHGKGGRCAACTYLALTCVKLQEKRISIRAAAAAWSLCPGARSHHRYRGDRDVTVLGPLPLDKKGRWARGGGGTGG
jgi:hypothetical protein